MVRSREQLEEEVAILTKEVELRSAGIVLAEQLVSKLRKRLKRLESRVYAGTAVVLRRADCIVMGRRKGSHGAGTFSLPGGALDNAARDPGQGDKTMKEGACRELLEETGIDLLPVQLTLLHVDDSQHEGGGHWVTLFFEVELVEGVEPILVEPNKCEGWDWYATTDLPEPLFGAFSKLVDSGKLFT